MSWYNVINYVLINDFFIHNVYKVYEGNCMKYFKHLTAVAFVALFTNFSYADDISGMIFQGNEIDDALIVNSTVTLTKQTKSANIQKTKSERDIDLFIEKAKNDAAKKEEEKLRQEKMKKE